MDIHSYLLADRSMHYDEQVAKNVGKWASRIQVQMKFQILDLMNSMSIIGFLHALKMAFDNNRIHKGSVMWFVLFFPKKQQLQSFQIVAWQRQGRYAHIFYPGCKPPFGDLHNRRYNRRSRHGNNTLHSADEHAAIILRPFPMDEDISLLTREWWRRTKGSVRGRLIILDKAYSLSFWGNNKHATLQKITYKATTWQWYTRQVGQWMHQTVFVLPATEMSRHQVFRRLGDDVTSTQSGTQAVDNKRSKSATLTEKSQILTNIENVQAQDEQNHDCSKRYPQVTHRTGLCVNHSRTNRTKRRNVPFFLPKLEANHRFLRNQP